MVGLLKLNKVDELVVSTLKSSDQGLTLAEIAEKIGESEKKVYRALRKLFGNEVVDCVNRRYKLSSK